MKTAWCSQEGSLRLRIRLTPNGGRDAVDGLEQDADGHCHLKTRVRAVPEDGKANKALIALLAKSLKVPKTSISIISGDTSRKKMLRIDNDPEHLIERLESLIS